MEWFKKHVDMFIMIGVIFGIFSWMNVKFDKIDNRFSKIEDRLVKVEQDMAIIKTVLIMKNIVAQEVISKAETEE